MAMILKTVGPARGAHWVRDGLRLYLKRPLAFTSLFVSFMFVVFLIAVVPVPTPLRLLLLLLAFPLLTLGMMVASQSVLLGGGVSLGQFVEPFRAAAPAQRRALVGLCFSFAVTMLVVVLLGNWIADDGFTRWAELVNQDLAPDVLQAKQNALMAERGMVGGTLFIWLMATVIAIPFWHAPALVYWARQSAAQSLFSSALAVWRCRGAFLIYGLCLFGTYLATLVAAAIATQMFAPGMMTMMVDGAAWLFLSTLFYVSLIFTFNDSFAPQ
jgi:hypothetical protein